MVEKKIVVKLDYGSGTTNITRSFREPEPVLISQWNVKRIAVAGLVLFGLVAGLVYFIVNRSPQSNENLAPVALVSMPEVDSGRLVSPGEEPSVAAGAMAEPLQESSKRPAPVIEKATAGEKTNGAERDDKTQDEEGGRTGQIGQETAAVIPAINETVEPVSAASTMSARSLSTIGRAHFTHAVRDKEPVDVVRAPVRAEPGQAVELFYFTELHDLSGQMISHHWLHEGRLVYSRHFRVAGPRWRIYTSKLLNTAMLGHWEVVVKDHAGNILHADDFDLLPPAEEVQQ